MSPCHLVVYSKVLKNFPGQFFSKQFLPSVSNENFFTSGCFLKHMQKYIFENLSFSPKTENEPLRQDQSCLYTAKEH